MIGILGGGTMGLGIAVALSGAGHKIVLVEPDAGVRAAIPARLDAISEEGLRVVPENISVTDSYNALHSASLVIEAVPENLEIKQALYDALFPVLPVDAIVASNTSTMPPDQLSERLSDECAARFLVAHFWHPPYFLPLVELLAGSRTNAVALETVRSLLSDAGLKPVKLDRAVPGFIGNRLQAALMREALHLVQSEVATPQVIDDVMRYSLGRRWSVTGPLQSADLGGIHIFSAVSDLLYPVIANEAKGSSLLAEMAASGRTGARVNRGFYEWTQDMHDEVARRRRRWIEDESE